MPVEQRAIDVPEDDVEDEVDDVVVDEVVEDVVVEFCVQIKVISGLQFREISLLLQHSIG